MFRNQYDTDVTVWSPEGRLLQVRTVKMTTVHVLHHAIRNTTI